MSWIRVKCSRCDGSRYNRGCKEKSERHFDDYCEECHGTGRVLVSESEARALLLQKQIEDARL